MGSKARHAKEIIPFLMDGHNKNKPYVEPFVGGGNLFSLVPNEIKWGNDINEYAVALLDAIGNASYIPPSQVSELDYQICKAYPGKFPKCYVGFLAFCCSYAGKFWGGYARGEDSYGLPRNFAAEQVRSLEKQRFGLSGAVFSSVNYLDLEIPEGSTIYCDPPYFGTTKYKIDFDHEQFWVWVKEKSERNRVFVSEYSAPDWATCVWEKRVTNSLTRETGARVGLERLFKCYK